MNDVEGPAESVRDLGVRLAIDDFAPDTPPCHYLRRFPINILKIKPVLRLGDGRDQGIGGGSDRHPPWSSWGRSLGLTTVAEGVESDEQRERLTRAVKYQPGFLFSRPLDAADVEYVWNRSAAVPRAR